MHTIISPKTLQHTLFKFMRVLVLSLSPLWCINGQGTLKWQIVRQLPAQTEKAFYIDRAPDSNKPDTILRSPILEGVFFIDNLNGWAVSDRGHVIRTKNGGQTWTARKISLPLDLKGIFFVNRLKGWMIGNAKGGGVILKTEDGGKNWHVQTKLKGFELSGLHNIWFADEQHGWAVGEAQQEGIVQGIILATRDGGIHWEQQYLAKERSSGLSAVEFADARRGWAVGHNVILYTENGGQQWREQHYIEGEYFFDVDFINSTAGWVVGSGGSLLHTIDSGATWHVRQLPAKYQNLWLASVRFIDSARGWIVGDNGAIFSTQNGGQKWKLESIGTSEYLRNLALTDRSVFAVGNGGVLLRRKI